MSAFGVVEVEDVVGVLEVFFELLVEELLEPAD